MLLKFTRSVLVSAIATADPVEPSLTDPTLMEVPVTPAVAVRPWLLAWEKRLICPVVAPLPML